MVRTHVRGFTLVELLVVIGIIAVLVGILLPSLSKARESANTIKCSANLHAVGQAMAIYLVTYNNTFPAAYVYQYMTLNGGSEQPTAPVWGYTHWSSFIYGDRLANGAPSNGSIYTSQFGWDMFTCPSIEQGGLPPTNTYVGNLSPGQTVDAMAPSPAPHATWNGCDQQAPRNAYTVNEALCPRNKFVLNFQGNASRVYKFVRTAQVPHSASTILATEWNPNWQIVEDVGEVSGNLVCKSHRPITGFVGLLGEVDLSLLPPYGGGLGGNLPTYRKVTVNDLQLNPTIGASIRTRLDWVGRNHGSKKIDGRGWNTGLSNFLYVDGHVETKSIRDTLSPKFEWGDDCYTLSPRGDKLPG
jgi:prepilin-type N-terminal cleavage/methylation domain-containing protein/prepilin-type processing-associated H-X9-DG protein